MISLGKMRKRLSPLWQVRRFAKRFGYSIEPLAGGTLPFSPRNSALFLYLHDRFREIADVPGDLVECGVGKGYSLVMLALLNRYHQRGSILWGFDSFEGFPDPTPEDESMRKPIAGDSWAHAASEKNTRSALGHAGFDAELGDGRVRLVRGFFDQTLDLAPPRIALLHLDVDLYGSYKMCLERLYDRVSPGGVILFDEYQGPRDGTKWPGARKAIDEFSAPRGLAIKFDPRSDKSYVTKPR